ncbi:MAG: NAD(P)-binding domain-containing protein [Rhodobacteraceae bacterium]|nr:NAD(P)-binding domain-containing protein [Paracoccaceae bacterium]
METLQDTDTVIVGGGQAGLAASRHLMAHGVPHVVLERARIAESWRTRRWDSLVANGPAWHDRFPELEFEGDSPNSFAGKDRVAEYFETYAKRFGLPLRCGVNVNRVARLSGAEGFQVNTSLGKLKAKRVIAATGPFQKPVIPPLIPESAGLCQLHSADYRNPDALPDGGVLVVGAGSSGVQIADELIRAGRDVTLSVGPHARPPRSYRGLDYCWWLGVLGKWESPQPDPDTDHITIAVSGAHGGRTVDFRQLGGEGVTLVGMAESFSGTTLRFAGDLADNIAAGDADYLSVLDEADAYAAAYGLDLPAQPEARVFPPDPPSLINPVRALDLAAAGITTVLWATGYAPDFNWLRVNAFDSNGHPAHQRGVSTEPGVYFLGLPWLSRRGSSFIWGVWHDAKYIADQIAIRRNYADYQMSAIL